MIQDLPNLLEMHDVTTNNLSVDIIDVGNETASSVKELGEELMTYKTNVFLFKYLTVPIAVWGWTGNFLSFRVMTLPRNRKTSVNIFLAALACSDSLHLLFSVHDWLLSMIEYKSDWMCKMIFWYGLVARCSSYAFVIIVTLQRCVAITLPLKRMEWMSVKSAKTRIIPLVILFNILYSSYTVFLLIKANPEKFGCIRRSTNPIVTRIGLIMTLAIDITIPFGTISILNAILIWAVQQRNRNFDSFGEVGVSSNSNAGSSQKKSQQEGRQLTLTLIFVCVAFLLLVSPVFLLLTIFTFINKFASPERFANFSLLYVIFKTCLHINAGINFWLYCSAGNKFRADLKVLLGCSSSDSGQNDISSNRTLPTLTSSVAARDSDT